MEFNFSSRETSKFVKHGREKKGQRELEVVSRAVWEAEPPRTLPRLILPATAVFFIFTGAETCSNYDSCLYSIRKSQYVDMYMNKLPDVRFNFAIGGDLRVWEGRGWDYAPSLPFRHQSYAQSSIMIAFFGDFFRQGTLPPNDMYYMFEAFIISGISKGCLNNKFLQFDI